MFKSTRKQVFVIVAALVTPQHFSVHSHADILRWDNGELIPGSEGIEPGPATQLSQWNSAERNLQYADFGRRCVERVGHQCFDTWVLYRACHSRSN